MNIFIILSLALILDALLGEPSWLWNTVMHPVRVMGLAIEWCDSSLNRGPIRRAKGVLAIAGLALVALLLGWAIRVLPDFGVAEVLVVAVLVGHRSLSDHVLAVARALQNGLPEGRRAVSMIVGRDTADLDESSIARAAIESAAENFSDGVVAPLFWYLVLGPAGIIAYKLINTADSMIGHRSDKYLQFGWGAARLDDLVNYIPARLSALLIIAATVSKKGWEVALKDASLHRSPNAGWPEAAMAGALDVALSGPRMYDGVATGDPYVNGRGKRGLNAGDIRRSVRVIWRAWLIMLALGVVTGAVVFLL